MAWNELALHRWIARTLGARAREPFAGDDAASLAGALRRPVVCVDQVIVGVHVEASSPPRLWGRKACARALSDLAASAADPRAVLCALRAPAEAHERTLRAILRGVEDEARLHGAALVGGDLACSPGPLGLSVSAVGEGGKLRAPGRGGARPGDVLVATGPLGGSLLGRHLRLVPRLAEGRWLVQRGARAMIDVSDGLALDAARLARASGVRLDLDEVPVHRDARRAARLDGRPALHHALFDGEDHELLAAVPARAWPRLAREAAESCPRLARIGHVRAGRGVHARIDGEDEPARRVDGLGGWVHGRG